MSAVSLSVTAKAAKVKTPGESILFGFDFTNILETGETLTGTPTVVCTVAAQMLASGGAVAVGDLTGGSITAAVNTAAFDNDDGVSVAIGKGVQARITGGVAGGDYTLKATAATNQSNTRELICTLKVRSE
jgi:hypothetical protein